MKILAAGALLLLAALAVTDSILPSVTDPACGPCLQEVVANGPGSPESKEFAHYFCLGEGANAVADCAAKCGPKGPSESDDPVVIAAVGAQHNAIRSGFFFYCFAHYREETCQTAELYFGGPLKICSGHGPAVKDEGGTTMGTSTATGNSTVCETLGIGEGFPTLCWY
ncbi:hypothetical protein VTI74DRAFT_6052 [Chaetomium olivicolor]